jgi:hypothetical protein
MQYTPNIVYLTPTGTISDIFEPKEKLNVGGGVAYIYA